MNLTVVLERWPDGSYVAYVRDLPGCVSEGDSRAEAAENLREALRLYLDDCRANQEAVPETDSLDFVETGNREPGYRFPNLHPSPELKESLERMGFQPRGESQSHILMRRDIPFSRMIIMKRIPRSEIDEFWKALPGEERTQTERTAFEQTPAYFKEQYAFAMKNDPLRAEHLRRELIDGYVQKQIRAKRKSPGAVVNLTRK
jgi:predicted RNase H-like HicB family nuclease